MLPYFVLHFLLLLLFLLSTKAKVVAYRVDFLFVFLDVSQTVCPFLLASVRQLNCCLWLLHTVVCVSVAVPPLYFSITTNCKIKLNHGSAAPNPKHGLNIHKQKVQKKNTDAQNKRSKKLFAFRKFVGPGGGQTNTIGVFILYETNRVQLTRLTSFATIVIRIIVVVIKVQSRANTFTIMVLCS